MSGLATQAGMFSRKVAGGSPVADSIVALWDFESASQTADSAGSSTLIESGTVPVATGIIGDAAGVFSSSNYFSTSGHVGPSGTDAMAVSMWFKTSSTSPAAQYLYTSGDQLANGNLFLLSLESGTGTLWCRCQGRTMQFDSGYNDDQWHYITVSRPANADLTDTTVWVDGVERSPTIVNSDGPLSLGISRNIVIGNYNLTKVAPFLGVIDQVVLANDEWTLSDHEYAHKSGSGRPTSELLTP